MSSASAKAYGAVTRSDVFLIDPRKPVIEEDDPAHPDYKAHEPRRAINPRMLRLIKTKGAKAIGEIRIKLKKLEDGSTIVVMRDGRVRLRHAREVLREKLTEMGADYDTFEPTKDDPLPLLLRAVPEDDKDATLVFNSYAKKDPPLMIAQKCAELAADNVPEEQIEILVNRSTSSIKKYLKLWHDAVPEVKDALHADKISFNQAYRLCEKSEAKQREAIARIIERGAKRGRRAQEAADGAEAKPRPRAPAKVAEVLKELPEGPARAAVEWTLGLRESIDAQAKASEMPAVLRAERDPDDVREIDALKSEIEKLREDAKIARKPNVEQEAQLDGALREVEKLKAEIEEAKSETDLAVAVAEAELAEKLAEAERRVRFFEVREKGRESARDRKHSDDFDPDDVEKAAIEAFTSEHGEPTPEQRAHVEWIAHFCAEYVLDALDTAIEQVKGDRENLSVKEEDIEKREDAIEEAEHDRERLASLPTDEEIEAAAVDQLRFVERRGRLAAFLANNPGARPVAVKHGLIQAEA